MKKLFRVSTWGVKISEVDVIKETEHTIWYYNSDKTRELQERKNTSENKHFETYQEAKDYLIKVYSEKVERYKNLLEYAEKDLVKVINNNNK